MKVVKVHFAGIILGRIYVAVRFQNGVDRHFWLQEPAAWQANTIYDLNTLVQPSVPNGFYYLTNTQSKAPPWAPDQKKSLGDVVQPTVPNGWEYVVTQITGAATTGDSEPAWPTADGAMVFETPDGTSVPSTTNTNADGKTAAQVGLDQLIKDRYNLGDDQ